MRTVYFSWPPTYSKCPSDWRHSISVRQHHRVAVAVPFQPRLRLHPGPLHGSGQDYAGSTSIRRGSFPRLHIFTFHLGTYRYIFLSVLSNFCGNFLIFKFRIFFPCVVTMIFLVRFCFAFILFIRRKKINSSARLIGSED
jgi:hypothetical protein